MGKQAQMKTSKIGMSQIVLIKKYYSDGCFENGKNRVVFGGDCLYDLYANKTHAGTVMSETVLTAAATEDMEKESLDVNTAFLYGDVTGEHIYML